MNTQYQNFGEFLQRKRTEKQITLRKMAEMIGITAPYLTDIEKDRRNPPEMEKLELISQILMLNDEDKTTMYDLAGKKIGTQRGTTGYIYCSDDFGDDAVVAYDNGLTAVQALNNGQVDAVVIDNAPAQEFVAANPGLKILDTAYAQEDYAIGVAKGNTQLLDAINGALEELQADGTLQAIVDKYITAE